VHLYAKSTGKIFPRNTRREKLTVGLLLSNLGSGILFSFSFSLFFLQIPFGIRRFFSSACPSLRGNPLCFGLLSLCCLYIFFKFGFLTFSFSGAFVRQLL